MSAAATSCLERRSPLIACTSARRPVSLGAPGRFSSRVGANSLVSQDQGRLALGELVDPAVSAYYRLTFLLPPSSPRRMIAFPEEAAASSRVLDRVLCFSSTLDSRTSVAVGDPTEPHGRPGNSWDLNATRQSSRKDLSGLEWITRPSHVLAIRAGSSTP